jgi:hypothetical protein
MPRRPIRIMEKGTAIYACGKSHWEYAKRMLGTRR